jgi:hypothetical protein
MDFSSSGFLPSLYRTTALVSYSIHAEFLRPSAHFRRSLKRFGVLCIFGVALPLHVCWQHLGFLLDDIFYCDYRRASISSPVFIVSNARSGSTLLQRLLFSSKKADFSSISVWEMLFAQSVAYRRLFMLLGRVDSLLLRGLLGKFIRRLDESLASWSRRHAPHPFSLLQPDEDEWMMSSFGMCQLMGLLFPLLDSRTPITRLVDFDSQLSQSEKKEYWGAYASLVKRHLYFEERFRKRGSSIRYLAKNPTFTLRLSSLTDSFRDAQIVVVVRDPHKAIPSMVSYICAWWSLVASPRMKYPFRNELQGMCAKHYTYPLQVEQESPIPCEGHESEQEGERRRPFVYIRYEQLQEDVQGTMRTVLGALRVDEAASFSLASVQAILGETFLHKYNIKETLGLSEEAFRQRHSGVFDAYPSYLRGNS